jgi:hypothetical protein
MDTALLNPFLRLLFQDIERIRMDMAGPVFYRKTVCRLQRAFLKGFICLPHPAFEDPLTNSEIYLQLYTWRRCQRIRR